MSNEEDPAVSKDLKKRGFRFVGTTVIYAHLQAAGVVNDHEELLSEESLVRSL